MKRLSILIIFFLIACTPKQTPAPTSLPSTAGDAQEALIRFFDLLNAKQYAEADLLFDGDYEQLQIFNPDVIPSDHASLWAGACEQAGLQCLKVRNAVFQNLQGDTHVFQVEFSNADGSLFVLGPCCGADEI